MAGLDMTDGGDAPKAGAEKAEGMKIDPVMKEGAQEYVASQPSSMFR